MNRRFYPALYPPADVAVLQGGGKVFGESFDDHEAAVARAESMYDLAVKDGIGKIVLPFVVVADDTGDVVQIYGVEPAGSAEPARAANPQRSKRPGARKRTKLRLKLDSDGYVRVKAPMRVVDVMLATDRMEREGKKIEGVYYHARGTDYIFDFYDYDLDADDYGGVSITAFNAHDKLLWSGSGPVFPNTRVIDIVRTARRTSRLRGK